MDNKNTECERQKRFRDLKREQGYVHLQAWVKHEHRKQVKQFIKELNKE